MEYQEIQKDQPKHFRVQIEPGASPETKQEALDANFFLSGLSTIETWRSNTLEPRVQDLGNSPEIGKEDVTSLGEEVNKATKLLMLMRTIPSIRNVEADENTKKPEALSETFTKLSENFSLPEDIQLTTEYARDFVYTEMNKLFGQMEGQSVHKPTVTTLDGIPGNFWKVASLANHDIMNPISNIENATSLMVDFWEESPEEQKQLLGIIEGSLPRLKGSIEKSASLISNEFPKDKLTAEAIRVEVLTALSPRVKKGMGIDFEMQTEKIETEEMGYVLWSRPWLQTLLDNVYQNEAKAYRGKTEGKITTKLSTESGWLVISIADDAGGFQDERILKEGFGYGYGSWANQEEDTGRQVESTKIGMAGQAEAIQKYSGRIVPENYTTEDGKAGARINIILPLHK